MGLKEREKENGKEMFCHCERRGERRNTSITGPSLRLPAAPIIYQVAIIGAAAAGRGQGEEDEEEKEEGGIKEEEEEEEETRLTPVQRSTSKPSDLTSATAALSSDWLPNNLSSTLLMQTEQLHI